LGITEAAWHEREAGVAQITGGAEESTGTEAEAAATTETVSITVELTAVQYADLEREAARVYRDIEPRYLTESPATVLLNSRVQKHWRTLVGK
jgi:hypothetical protein